MDWVPFQLSAVYTDIVIMMMIIVNSFDSQAAGDGASGIGADCQILQHHWEQPHVDCAGLECRFCFRVPSYSLPYGQPASASGNPHAYNPGAEQSSVKDGRNGSVRRSWFYCLLMMAR